MNVKNISRVSPGMKSTPSSAPFPIGPPNTIVLATTNSAFLDFTENWLYSIQRCGVWPNITVIAEDRAAYETLLKKNFDIHVTLSNHLGTADNLIFNTPEFNVFTHKRANYILEFLQNGHNVLFSDVDTYWFENPFAYFEQGYEYDIYSQADHLPPGFLVLCSGFTYFKASQKTLKFVQIWISRLASTYPLRRDQLVFNEVISQEMKRRRGVKVKVLDPKKFVSGRYYFDEDWRSQNPDVKPVVLHNNWVIGHDVKVERFKQIGKWFIS